MCEVGDEADESIRLEPQGNVCAYSPLVLSTGPRELIEQESLFHKCQEKHRRQNVKKRRSRQTLQCTKNADILTVHRLKFSKVMS